MSFKVEGGKLIMKVAHEAAREPAPAERAAPAAAAEEAPEPEQDEAPRSAEIHPERPEEEERELIERNAGPVAADEDAVEEEAPEAPAEEAEAETEAEKPAKTPRVTKRDAVVEDKLAFHDHIVALGNKHDGIKREYALALQKEGLAIPEHLQQYLQPAKAAPASGATQQEEAQKTAMEDPRVRAEFTKIMKTGDIMAAIMYLNKETNKELFKMREEFNQERTTQKTARENEQITRTFNDGMLQAAGVYKDFFTVKKVNGESVAEFKTDADSVTLHKKMIEISGRKGIPDDAGVKLITTLALEELGWLGREVREERKPAIAPSIPAAKPAAQQGQARSTRNGSTVVKDGKMIWKVRNG